MYNSKLDIPSISFEKAQEKIKKSMANIIKNQGIESNQFFKQLFSKEKEKKK